MLNRDRSEGGPQIYVWGPIRAGLSLDFGLVLRRRLSDRRPAHRVCLGRLRSRHSDRGAGPVGLCRPCPQRLVFTGGVSWSTPFPVLTRVAICFALGPNRVTSGRHTRSSGASAFRPEQTARRDRSNARLVPMSSSRNKERHHLSFRIHLAIPYTAKGNARGEL